MAGNMGKEPPSCHECGETDRHVHQEDQPPAGVDEQTADHRAKRGRQSADRRPGADRPVTPIGRVRGEHEPERCRCQQRRAGGLQHAEAHEHGHARRGSAGGRRRGEERDAGEEAELAAVAVREAPEEYEQRCVDDRVRVEDPRQAPQSACAEVARNVRQRDVDDEEIEARQHDPGRDDREHDRRVRIRAPRDPRSLAYGCHSQAKLPQLN